MSNERYFVAIDPKNGLPRAQRTSLRKTTYQSATLSGSFASKPPAGSYQCKVVEVPKALRWTARATLGDGTKVSQTSKSYAPGRNYVLYSYQMHGSTERREAVDSTNDTLAEWEKRKPKYYELITWAVGTVEVHNWPTPGDAIALPDA